VSAREVLATTLKDLYGFHFPNGGPGWEYSIADDLLRALAAAHIQLIPTDRGWSA
jgi:hypothetical protein